LGILLGFVGIFGMIFIAMMLGSQRFLSTKPMRGSIAGTAALAAVFTVIIMIGMFLVALWNWK
jgi:hypothetical protein